MLSFFFWLPWGCLVPYVDPGESHQDDVIDDLSARLTALEAKYEDLKAAYEDLETSHEDLQQQLVSIESDVHAYAEASVLPEGLNALADYLLVDADENTIRFVGANVYIQSGSGTTTDATGLTGLGNLIVGYNEDESGYSRIGSHNLIVGKDNGYAGVGGVVFGYSNKLLESPYSTITGGWKNISSGWCSSISGGQYNRATGTEASVSGGSANTASGDTAWVGGGSWSIAEGHNASSVGGHSSTTFQSRATGDYSVVVGGWQNSTTDTADYAVVLGGRSNVVSGAYALLLGGNNNTCPTTDAVCTP